MSFITEFLSSITACLTCSQTPVLKINRARFKILKLLGEGGFSYVYLVEAQNGGKYALKKIRCPFGAESVKVAMREVDNYKLFHSPSIIRAIDSSIVQEPDGTKTVYVLLPYFDKGSLQDIINQNLISNEYLNELDILRYFVSICKGIQAMHKHHLSPSANRRNNNVSRSSGAGTEEHDVLLSDSETDGDNDTLYPVGDGGDEEGTEMGETVPYAHRDIKPANVMIARDGTPILMDLGSCARARVSVKTRQSALELQELTAEHCTLPYRAPELFDVKTGSSIDERVDIWSLGCTLFALMYNSSPFEMMANDSGASVSFAIVGGNYKFPGVPEYSDGLKELVRMCLVVDPKERPFIEEVLATGQNLLRDLE